MRGPGTRDRALVFRPNACSSRQANCFWCELANGIEQFKVLRIVWHRLMVREVKGERFESTGIINIIRLFQWQIVREAHQNLISNLVQIETFLCVSASVRTQTARLHRPIDFNLVLIISIYLPLWYVGVLR